MRPMLWFIVTLLTLPFAMTPSIAAELRDTGVAVRVSTAPAIEREFETRFIAQRLNALGLSPSDVQARLEGLTDEEVHQLARNLHGTATALYALPLFVALIAIVCIAAIASRMHGPGILGTGRRF